MPKKTHDIDVRLMHSVNRIVENVKEGSSPDAIALLINLPGVDGAFISTLCTLHAANDRKAAYTKKHYKMMSRVTKDVLAEKNAEPAVELPLYDPDAITCKLEE